MNQYDKSFINILPASINSIFCYFNFSPSCIKEFEKLSEVNIWTTSRTILKLFYIENGISIEKQSIITDGLADNWYITLKENDVDLFVEIGKLTTENEYIPIATSNILSMPRTNQINTSNAYMIDISNNTYKLEILKLDTQLSENEKLEEYINKNHCDLSSSN